MNKYFDFKTQSLNFTALAFFLAALVACGVLSAIAAAESAKLKICSTVPDLADIASEIGGDKVEVICFAKGTEDPHFVEAKPGFIKELNKADMVLLIGMELELGWLPVLLQNARNPKVLVGGPGYIDCSGVIAPLDIPQGTVDRSMGDVHPQGNPHYLADPMNGLKVAQLIGSRLADAMPSQKEYFEKRFGEFRKKMGVMLVGEKLFGKYEFEKLMLLYENGKLGDFLKAQGDDAALGGAVKRLLPFFGAKMVDDHNMWSYFAGRYGFRMAGHMEAIAGVPPTTKNLRDLAELMKGEKVKAILTCAYYDSKHAGLLSKDTNVQIVKMANLVGSRGDAVNYLKMSEYNVNAIASALETSK